MEVCEYMELLLVLKLAMLMVDELRRESSCGCWGLVLGGLGILVMLMLGRELCL